MEGRKEPIREKGWFEQIKDGAASYMQQSREAGEKKVVEQFRKDSENVQKLIEIKEASEESKRGLFGNFGFVKTWSQLDQLGVEKIDNLLAATTFAGMLEALDVRFRNEDEKWKVETVCSVVGNVVQNANASHYMIQLHKEILAYVISHDIPLTNNQRPQRS